MSKLHVYRFDNTFDWFAAATPESAVDHWLESHDLEEDEDPPEPKQLDDDEAFELTDDGGDTFETKTCAEWAEERGPGWIAREL